MQKGRKLEITSGLVERTQQPISDQMDFQRISGGFLLVHVVDLLLVLTYSKEHLGNAPRGESLRLRERPNHLELVPGYEVKWLIVFLKLVSKIVCRWDCCYRTISAAIFPLGFSWKVEIDSTLFASAPILAHIISICNALLVVSGNHQVWHQWTFAKGIVFYTLQSIDLVLYCCPIGYISYLILEILDMSLCLC